MLTKAHDGKGVTLPKLEVELDEGLFLLRVWHEGGEGDVWGWALSRVMPDDSLAASAQSIRSINAIADVALPPRK